MQQDKQLQVKLASEFWWRCRKKNGTRKNRDHAVPISQFFRFPSVTCHSYLFETFVFAIRIEIRLLWDRKRNEVRKPLHARFSPLADTPKPPLRGPYSPTKPSLRSNVPFFFRQMSKDYFLTLTNCPSALRTR